MFEIEIVTNGKRVRTETRNTGVSHLSALATYRDCGWTVVRHSYYSATASRVV